MESGNWLKSRGITFLVGLATLWLLFRWWFRGTIFHAVEFATGEPSSGFQSAGTIMATIAIDVILTAGTLAIAVWSQVWDFLWTVIQSFWQKAASQPTQPAVVAQVPKALAAIQTLHARVKALEAEAVSRVEQPAANAATPASKPVKKPAAKPKAKVAAKKEPTDGK